MTQDPEQVIDAVKLLTLIQQEESLLLEEFMIVAAGELYRAGKIQADTGQDGEIYLSPAPAQ